VKDRQLVDELLARLLEPRMGRIPASWPRRVYEIVQRAALGDGQDPLRVLAQALRSAESALADQLVAALTVGHTSFFRHPEQFETLRRKLPELARRRPTPLQLWCAGCSTGEEVYSAALAANQAGVAVQILGTDVNRYAIETARAGRYSSKRSELPGGGRSWEAPPSLKRSVRFEVASLAAADPTLSPARFDIIFCRNVLIYFDRESVPELLESMSLLLAPRGAIIISPADAVLPLPDGLAHGTAVGWLHRAGHPPFSSRHIPLRRSEHPTPRSLPPLAARPPIELAALALSSGQLAEAEAKLTQLLNDDPDDMAAWFLLGEVLLQRGEPAQSRAAFMRAHHSSVRHTTGVDEEALRAAALRRARL
jgi:chemotaxis protein methyltransferase CheR